MLTAVNSRVLIVIAHPDPSSFTHRIGHAVAAGAQIAGLTVEVADLAAEAFDSRFSEVDVQVSLNAISPAPDVLREQSRIDAVDDLVLVYPVYWWSMPALLKGWIERVFSNGWAFGIDDQGSVVRKLDKLRVHLLAIGGADRSTYLKHGYRDAMKTQIDHGIFAYCGARVVHSELLLPGEGISAELQLDCAKDLGASLSEQS